VSEALALRPEPELFLGRYRGIRPLGSGGSGSVWLARDERSGRDVAVKIVPREGKAGSRARREAQAMAKLDHVRCLRAYACGRDAENVYIAYAYVPGRTFREALRAGELTDADAIEAAAQVLEGLAHAHERGIVHRDVKPANVLLADEGGGISVRVLDFGLARFAEGDTLTAAGDVPGTLAYIAPERLHGEPAGPAGDVWSVGVLLYEALAGRHPFWRSSLAETADAITHGASPLRTERPDLPASVLAAVDRALALDPARRPSAAKLARMLRRARRGRDGGALATAARLERRWLAPVLAGVYAAAATSLIPFYPAHAAPALAALTTALAFRAPRSGLALALALPILPLGNVALALALLYAAVALIWFLLHVGDPKRALLPVFGPLLGPLVLGLLPLVFFTTRSAIRRALGAAAALALSAVVGGLRGGPIELGIPGGRDPVAAADALMSAAPHALLFEAPGLAFAALVLPWAVRQGRRLTAGAST
jgi:serine/threonine-protein kinase